MCRACAHTCGTYLEVRAGALSQIHMTEISQAASCIRVEGGQFRGKPDSGTGQIRYNSSVVVILWAPYAYEYMSRHQLRIKITIESLREPA